MAEIVQKVDEGKVQGILLDTYIAGEFQDQLGKLRLQQVIDYTFSYGVVLSRDGLALRKCFSHFLESKQSQIYATISKVIKPLKVTVFASCFTNAGRPHFMPLENSFAMQLK